MPFLLLDDAADEATRRLTELGQQQLAMLGSSAQGAVSGIQQGAQDLGASAQDATQRLMQLGQQQLQSLQPQAPPPPDLDAITGRLHAFGQQQLENATSGLQQGQQLLNQGAQAAQQGIQQLQPLQPLAPPAPPPAPTPLGQPQQDQPLDKNGVISYVQQKARDYGLDPAAVLAVANQEGLNTDPGSHWQLPGEKNISFGPPSWYGNGAGADIIAKHGDDAARWSWTPEGIDYWLSQVQSAAQGLTGNDAVAAIVNKFERPREDLAAGEIEKAKAAYNQFVGGVQQGAQAVQQGAQDLTNKLGQQSQFGDSQLSQAEAYAACGPAAAIRFAQMFGRNPTLREATDLATQVGWTPQQGMAGLSSEASLFTKMQIPNRVVGADWNALAKEASSGNPVVISTPGHYFTADAYDPSTGAFHVGQSGKDLVHGGEWMTPQQMQGLMGNLQGGLAVDNPGVSTPSPLATGGDLLQQGGQAIQQGLSSAKNAAQQGITALDQGGMLQTAGDLATGGLTRRFNQNLQGLASDLTGGRQLDLSQGIKPITSAVADSLDSLATNADATGTGGGLVTSDAMRLGANFLRSPSVLDSIQIAQDLATKYGTMDTSQYSPEDQQKANQALMAVGGVVGGTSASTRMFHGTPADFPRATPEAVSGERNLYGPGYYLTSDPRVAGGVIAKGGEPDPLGPLMREGRPFERGDVIQSGYAQQNPNATSDTLDLGANVRAVDVPGHLNLLDMEQPLPPAQAQAVAQQLNVARPGAWDPSNPDVQSEVRSWSQPGTDGASVYNLVRGELDGTKAAANKVLAQAGLDGITYAGGKRIPMADEAGVPIEHQATVIFPESLDKVTNATARTQGGAVAAPYALGLGGAAAAGLGALKMGGMLDGGGFQAPSLDDVGEAKDRALSAIADFRDQQAAGDTRDLGFTAPVADWLRDRVSDVTNRPEMTPEEVLKAGQDLNYGVSPTDLIPGAGTPPPAGAGTRVSGDILDEARRRWIEEHNPLNAVPGTSGLAELVTDPTNLALAGAALRPGAALANAARDFGASELGAAGRITAMERAKGAGGDLVQAATGPVKQQLEQDLGGRLTKTELDDARQTIADASADKAALNPYTQAQTPQGLARLRRQLVSLAQQGEAQKDWYDTSSRQIMDAAQGNKDDAEKIAQLAGIYSNNTPVDQNLDNALTAWHQWKAGEPINAPTLGENNRRARELLEQGIQWDGRKTNNFYRNLMMHIDHDRFTELGNEAVDGVRQTGVTIDVWMQRALNSLRKAPSTQAQYDWAANEIKRVADQLGWRPDQAQAAIWSAAKAGWEDEKYGTDLAKAGWSYADALRKRLTSPLGGEIDDQLQAALRDPETGRDELARAFGLLGEDGRVSVPQARQSETIGGTEVKYPENIGKVQPEARALLNGYTAARALLTRQSQLGWSRLFPAATQKDADAAKLVASSGRFTPEQVSELQGHLDDLVGAGQVHVVPSDDGAWVLNRGSTPNQPFFNAVQNATSKLSSVEELTAARARHDGEILRNDWEANPDGEGYLATIRQLGSERVDQFQRARERLQPAIDDLFAGRGAAGGGDAGAAGEGQAIDAGARQSYELPGQRGLRDFLTSESGAAPLPPNISQSDLRSIRQTNLNANLVPPPGARGPIARAVDLTKQGMLSNPTTSVTNFLGNTINLAKSPVSLTLGGRPQDAAAGVRAVAQGIPEAATNAFSAIRGNNLASLGTPARVGRSGWQEPVFRALSAADAFTRTLGEYQGMAEQASYLLRRAGLDGQSPAGRAFLQAHAQEIAAAGRRSGASSVFATDAAAGNSALDRLANTVSRYKEDMLASPRLRDQALGALLDTQLPFLGVPTRMLDVGARSLPVASQLTGAYRFTRAARAGNWADAQRALGETAMETAIQIWLAHQISQGNITGPEDPDHPSSANILGNWVNLNNVMGSFALPAQIMAGFAEGHAKALQRAPVDLTDEETQRLGNALNGSIKPLAQAVPGMQMLHFLGSLGSGEGITNAVRQELADSVSRIIAPGAGKFLEDLRDPYQRDTARTGLSSLWEPAQARIPVAAERLPARIDMTTGEPMEKRRSGPGVLLGVESADESKIREVANDFARRGYDTKPPTTYPNAVSINGVQVNLKPDEQRAVAEIVGKRLGNFAERMDQPAFKNADEVHQAAMVRAYLQAAENARESAVVQVLGRDETIARIRAGQKDVGRVRNQGPGLGNVLGDVFNFSSADPRSYLEQRTAALAGS